MNLTTVAYRTTYNLPKRVDSVEERDFDGALGEDFA